MCWWKRAIAYSSKIRIGMESEENNVDQDATEDDADAQGSLGLVGQQCE